jgi:hypothetical protein
MVTELLRLGHGLKYHSAHVQTTPAPLHLSRGPGEELCPGVDDPVDRRLREAQFRRDLAK